MIVRLDPACESKDAMRLVREGIADAKSSLAFSLASESNGCIVTASSEEAEDLAIETFQSSS